VNPLITQATADRHTECCQDTVCKTCGAHVSGYNCNASLITQRPEGQEWDWWMACDNEACVHAWGEGVWQDTPDWVGTHPVEKGEEGSG
jgi:hypothetical protein